jgi:hypothetical protein
MIIKMLSNPISGFLCKLVYNQELNVYILHYFKNHESEKEEITFKTLSEAYAKMNEYNHAS